ncbi:GNAT family N-acetyltransferase [Microbacterium proteolyticum]|uniref:GNAT family N-acetyltransferase n=1 Tax=Microbacterium proteolyticum TaxID=1572644 RepID=UPI001FACDBC2|nr:GNAT family N-acetyltransferase [Microbacterium proteolyticum]MCI9859201.1 GNAT family N-acetyltransferase [Microbacterium proteolyticum]
MTLTLTRVEAGVRDRDALTAFLTGNIFPFHVRERLTVAQVTADIDAGRWGDDRTEAFWIDDHERGHIGLLRLDDLGDPTAVVDLRLAERWRGRDVGAGVLTLAVEHTFRTHAGVVRVEGHTREDNIAMRRTFEKSGWVREGWFRDGWPVMGGAPLASVAYAVLRRDWASGETTLVPRDPGVGALSPRTRDAETLITEAWAAEERLLDPAVRADADELRRLLADDFTEIGRSGRRWTRDDIIVALAAETTSARPPTIEERESRLLGPETVLLTYLLRADDRVSRRSSVWQGDPRPRCVFHQGTAVHD